MGVKYRERTTNLWHVSLSLSDGHKHFTLAREQLVHARAFSVCGGSGMVGGQGKKRQGLVQGCATTGKVVREGEIEVETLAGSEGKKVTDKKGWGSGKL